VRALEGNALSPQSNGARLIESAHRRPNLAFKRRSTREPESFPRLKLAVVNVGNRVGNRFLDRFPDRSENLLKTIAATRALNSARNGSSHGESGRAG